VSEGRIWAPPYARGQARAQSKETKDVIQRLKRLTRHQLRVLLLLREGNSNKQIASDLNVTEQTVKMHVSGILRKFGVNSRVQAVILASKIELNQ
jgi:DNA-binding NarL/FixJ family response regulator